jgi:asparagine synthase (glutamine-hydrolysing)
LRERPQDGIEPRYYYRMYDLNGPGWRAIRRLAEPHRETLSDLFDVKALREYLPPPEDTIEMRDTIVDGSGRKLLLGLMLWRGRVGI